MPRIARIVAVNYPHHIIQRGNNKQDIFVADDDKHLYLYLLKKYSLENKCQISAYCLMSDHVHLLAVPLAPASLAKTMQKVSLTYTQYFNKKFQRTGRLWECRFHSTVVDTDSYLLTACRYIERNPVRAKIVDLPVDYPWSSARINVLGQRDDFIIPIWNEFINRKEYAGFLNQNDKTEDEDKLRTATYSGRPFGSEEFVDKLVASFGIKLNTRSKGSPSRKGKWDVSLS